MFYLVEADLISWKVGVVAIFCGRSLGAVGGWLFDHLLGFLQPEEHSPQKITAGTSERLWDISSVGHQILWTFNANSFLYNYILILENVLNAKTSVQC